MWSELAHEQVYFNMCVPFSGRSGPSHGIPASVPAKEHWEQVALH